MCCMILVVGTATISDHILVRVFTCSMVYVHAVKSYHTKGTEMNYPVCV